MKSTDKIKKLIKNSRYMATSEAYDKTLDSFMQSVDNHNKHKSAPAEPKIWRIIMKSPIKRVAAVVLSIACVAVWYSTNNHSDQQQSPLSFLNLVNTACAAEEAFFTGDHIVHITHEITLYPSGDAPDVTGQLDELIDSNFSRNKEADFIRAWFSSYVWLPVHSLGPDGELRWHKLALAETANQASTIQEHIWYDPVTGVFARVFKQDEQVLFAMSFDGQAVYQAFASDDGRFQVEREEITEQFMLPENPAEFLGISASFQGSMDMMALPPAEEQVEELLDDGTLLRVYKLQWEGTDAYHIFKVNDADNTIEQIESVAYEQPMQQIKRISTDASDGFGISWDLGELAVQTAQVESEVTFTKGISDITAQQMADRALVETFAFANIPDWIAEQYFIEVLDEVSPIKRMFMVLCQAEDGRHVILIQGSTLSQFLGAAFDMNKQSGFRWMPRVFDSNRFKMHVLPKMRHIPNALGIKVMDNWSKGLMFQDSAFEQSEDARGYILHSPMNTDFVMVINGNVSDEELEDLVGGLVPTRLYVESGDALDWYLDADPSSVTYQGFEPGVFMQDWLVLGSIPVFDEGLTFKEKFQNGKAQMLALEEDPFDIHQFEPTVVIGDKEYHWEFYHSPSELVDLSWPLGHHNFANAYALAQIEMEEETPVLLAIGDDDRIKVWLNGELVHTDTKGGHMVPDKAFVPVTLREGINRLLLKVQNGITEWQFTLRIFEEGYDPLEGEMKPELASVTYDGLEPGKFMTDWLILGPVQAYPDNVEPNWVNTKPAFDEDQLDSFEHFTPTVEIDGIEHEWTAYPSYTGIIDIHRAWPQGSKKVSEYVFAYAWAQVDMPEETTALLGIGADDAVKVWLNGELVHEKWRRGGAFPDHDRINVTFREGPNQLIFKIQNGQGRWKFCCRLLD